MASWASAPRRPGGGCARGRSCGARGRKYRVAGEARHQDDAGSWRTHCVQRTKRSQLRLHHPSKASCFVRHPPRVPSPWRERSPPPTGVPRASCSRTWPHCNDSTSLAVTGRIGQRLTAGSSENKYKKKALRRFRPQRSVCAAHAGVGARGTGVVRAEASLGGRAVGRKELVGVEVADHLLGHLGQDALGQRLFGSLQRRQRGDSATRQHPAPAAGREGAAQAQAHARPWGPAGTRGEPSKA